MNVLPTLLFGAAVLLAALGIPWWSLRREMRRDGLAPCLNHLENQAVFHRFMPIGIGLVILVGAVMAARRSDAPLVSFGLFVLLGIAVAALAFAVTLLPAAWELNRAVAGMVREGTRPPEPFAAAIRRCLRLTWWAQTPLFWVRGVTREQIEQLISDSR